jgi:hypothetical protein
MRLKGARGREAKGAKLKKEQTARSSDQHQEQ